MRTCSALIASLIVLAGAVSGAVSAQAFEPQNNFIVSANAAFKLCPKLVRGEPTPAAADLLKFGLTVGQSTKSDDVFEGLSARDTVQVSYDRTEKRCTVNYAGAGFAVVAKMARDVVIGNGLTRITGGEEDGAKADVFERAIPGRSMFARFIIIENLTSKTAAISYTEKAHI